jgi:hypothetical protein
MPSSDDLRQKACEEGELRARAALGELVVIEPRESVLAWNPSHSRQVFSQRLVVWARSRSFEVLVDEADRPVGFVDLDGWDGCEAGEVTDADLLELAQETGLVRGDAVVLERSTGERGCLTAMLGPRAGGGALSHRIRVDPRRRAVIAIEPVAEGSP